jgi:hypothetical protein
VHFWDNGNSQAQMDTLLVKPKQVESLNQQGLNFRGRLVVPMQSIPGEMLYGETQGRPKDIADFLVKLAYFKEGVLRPFECQLLMAGVVVDCQGNAFLPLTLEKQLDHVLCFRKCRMCVQELTVVVWVVKTVSGLVDMCEKCARLPATPATSVKVKPPELIPSLPLATLLAAGRFEIMNQVTSAVKRVSSLVETEVMARQAKRLKKSVAAQAEVLLLFLLLCRLITEERKS